MRQFDRVDSCVELLMKRFLGVHRLNIGNKSENGVTIFGRDSKVKKQRFNLYDNIGPA